jgi:hypothetical protein
MAEIDNFTYKDRRYEQLSEEFRQLFPTARRAFELIPMMHDRLTLVDKLTHKAAISKIREDHKDLPGFSGRNIRRYLPTDSPNVPRRIRPPRPKTSNTEHNVVPELSNTESTNLVEGYPEGHHSVEYVSDVQEYPHCADLVKNQKLEETNIPNTGTLGTQYKIPKEKFEILSNALARTRQVCFVLFDSNGELVKAEADIDKVTHVSIKVTKDDK